MDLRQSWRALWRSRGFSALVILTFAVGIGATTTMFSAVWAVFLRPLPYPAQDRLVTLWRVDPRTPGGHQRIVPADFVDWQSEVRSFESLGVLPNWSGPTWPFNVVADGDVDRVRGIYASSGFFRVMGVAPQLGRTFVDDDDRASGRRQVVISHRYWQRRFNGAADVVGRSLEVDTFRGGAFTIVGVMPPAFDLPRATEIWLSLADWGGGPMPRPGDDTERCCPWYTVVGRLKVGVSASAAQAELNSLANAVALRLNQPASGPVVVVPLRQMLTGDHAATLFGLFGAVGCILLIACANVANLLLSRGVSRRKEIVTRLALGATRVRLARQLVAEGLMLGSIGAALGLVASLWAQDLVRSSLSDRVPYLDQMRADGIVLGFTVLLTLLVSGACALVPLVDWRSVVWNARVETENRVSRRVRHVLVIAEVAIAVVVAASAGLLVKTVLNLQAVDVGFETDRTVVVTTDLTTTPLRTRGASAQFTHEALERIALLPGVAVAGATTSVPFEGGPAAQAITREGDEVRPAASSSQVVQSGVSAGYFRAMGVATLRGRTFTDADRPDGKLVAVINATAARRYWPGQDPIGRRFAVGSRERFGSFRAVKPGEVEWREIVGVVSDIRSAGFTFEVQPEVYYSYQQFPLYDPSFVIKTNGGDSSIGAIRTVLTSINPRVVIVGARTLDQIADRSIADPRLRAALATMFSAVALLLGILGIYGVMSYTVARQEREIGIRLALGARPFQVARAVLSQAMRLTAVGIVVGLAGSYVTARWISSLFFGVSAGDATILGVVCAVLFAVAALAAAIPARRALAVDPAVALRAE